MPSGPRVEEDLGLGVDGRAIANEMAGLPRSHKYTSMMVITEK